jgi:hypothetical protein
MPDALVQLTAALDNLWRALETRQPDEAPTTEPPMAPALDALPVASSSEATDRLALWNAVIDVRLTLGRSAPSARGRAAVAARLPR